MNFEDYETLPTQNPAIHMTAGAMAGVMEHCIMYPLDSVKTRMQSLRAVNNGTITETFRTMVRTEGLLRPVRGMPAVIAGAGPAHALYFATYEHCKHTLGSMGRHRKHEHLIHGFSGGLASLVHDAISNPTEVVKQRLQMYNSPYKGAIECLVRVYRTEGLKAFYRSYATQVWMNVPFQTLHFMSYEFGQSILNPTRAYSPPAHALAGALAGAIAAAATTPLDVCKTVLNTQESSVKVSGLIDACRHVLRMSGPRGFFKGISARVLYQMPATAICWSTYESFKYLLGNDMLAQAAVAAAPELPVPTSHTNTNTVISPAQRDGADAGGGIPARSVVPNSPAASPVDFYTQYGYSLNTLHRPTGTNT